MAVDPHISTPPPALLILSDEGPQTGTAGGLLLHRLLRGYPTERLHVLARHVPAIGDPLPGVDYRRLLIPWHRFESSRFHRLKRSLRAWNRVPRASAATIHRMLEGFTPQVVFTVMQHAQYYDTAAEVARSCRVPLVVAVHDVNDAFEPVYGWARRAAVRRDRAFYRQATARLCISPEMEQRCADVYGVRGAVLYPNREEALQPREIALAQTLREPRRLTVGFAGNLNYGYGAALVRMLPAIRLAGVRLVIYSRPPGPDAAELLQAADCCEVRGFVPSDEAWTALKRDCDLVWLPYPNPAGAMEQLYRHHFPSKLPEYLALGLPLLVTGPDNATGVRWARAHATAAVCEDGSSVERLAAVFTRMKSDAAWRLQLAQAGWEAGQRDFEPAAIRRTFLAHLTAAARLRP